MSWSNFKAFLSLSLLLLLVVILDLTLHEHQVRKFEKDCDSPTLDQLEQHPEGGPGYFESSLDHSGVWFLLFFPKPVSMGTGTVGC